MYNTNLNEKGCLVNSTLAEMCKEKNIYLIDHSRKIKSHHLNRGKVHLNKKGSHCVKVFKYGVISGPYFPVFNPNTGKYGPEITPYLDTFHAK